VILFNFLEWKPVAVQVVVSLEEAEVFPELIRLLE